MSNLCSVHSLFHPQGWTVCEVQGLPQRWPRRSPPLSLDLAEVPLLLLLKMLLSNSSGESPLNDGTAAGRRPWPPQGSSGHRSPEQGGPAGPPAPREAQRGSGGMAAASGTRGSGRGVPGAGRCRRLSQSRGLRSPGRARPSCGPRAPLLTMAGRARGETGAGGGPAPWVTRKACRRSRPSRRPPSGSAAPATPPGPGPPERSAGSCCPAVPPTLARGRRSSPRAGAAAALPFFHLPVSSQESLRSFRERGPAVDAACLRRRPRLQPVLPPRYNTGFCCLLTLLNYT